MEYDDDRFRCLAIFQTKILIHFSVVGLSVIGDVNKIVYCAVFKSRAEPSMMWQICMGPYITAKRSVTRFFNEMHSCFVITSFNMHHTEWVCRILIIICTNGKWQTMNFMTWLIDKTYEFITTFQRKMKWIDNKRLRLPNRNSSFFDEEHFYYSN